MRCVCDRSGVLGDDETMRTKPRCCCCEIDTHTGYLRNAGEDACWMSLICSMKEARTVVMVLSTHDLYMMQRSWPSYKLFLLVRVTGLIDTLHHIILRTHLAFRHLVLS